MYKPYDPTAHDLDRHDQIRKILGHREPKETAGALDMSPNAYSKKLNGKRAWTLRDCDEIAQLTGRVVRCRRLASP